MKRSFDSSKNSSFHGISLWDWQEECLAIPSLLQDGKSLVFSAPTGSGKSLVAEIILFRSLESTGKKVPNLSLS
jgi:replicative superfamily II helicase